MTAGNNNSMKSLKFAEKLIEPILDWQRTITWRVNDDKNLSEGDILALCDIRGNRFANARIVSAVQTTFGELTEEQKKEHGFDSDEQMHSAFSGYYGFEVNRNTELKMIRFQLL